MGSEACRVWVCVKGRVRQGKIPYKGSVGEEEEEEEEEDVKDREDNRRRGTR